MVAHVRVSCCTDACGVGACANWSVEILLVLNENKFFYKYDERNISIEYVKGKNKKQ
jgi:diaminopimelate epimerase